MKSNSTLTENEKKEIVKGFDASGLKVPEYCKQKKISLGQFYDWKRKLGKDNRPAKKKVFLAPEGKYEATLKAQNQILKEMLADAYAENAVLKAA